MRMTLLTVVILLGCQQSQTPQQKAEAAVKIYISANANDPSSYQPVSFSKVDSSFTTYHDEFYQEELDREKNLLLVAKDDQDPHEIDSFQKRVEMLTKKTTVSTFDGYKIYHASRGKNAFGALMLTKGTFYLDSNYKVKEFVASEDSLGTK